MASWTTKSIILLGKLTVNHLVKKKTNFMKTQISLSCLRKPVTEQYNETEKTFPYQLTIFIESQC